MNAWAIVVGINCYPKRTGLGPLKGAVADAADFADWALDPQGGAVSPDQMFFWTFPTPDPTTRLANWLNNPTPWWNLDDENETAAPDPARAPGEREVVETILRAGRAARESAIDGGTPGPRRCYVFFAGHGVQTNPTGPERDPQTCFVLGDFRPEASQMRGLIACEDLMRALLGCGFDEVFLFLDCCRLKLNTVNMPPPTISSANSFQPPAPVCGVCSAAQMNKAAFETATSPIRGAFSKALLQGLRTVRGPAQALTIGFKRAAQVCARRLQGS